MDWMTYSIRDFVPFGTDVYLRLLARVNDYFWPLPLVFWALGLLTLLLLFRRYYRLVSLLVAAQWLIVSVGFIQRFYAELNWLGDWLQWVFYLQALMLAALGVLWSKPGCRSRLRGAVGMGLCVFALAWPLIAWGQGEPWQAEIIGIHADPTAVFSLGLVVICFSSWRCGLLLLVPVLWAGFSALTLSVVEPVRAAALSVSLLVLLVLCIYQMIDTLWLAHKSTETKEG